MAFDISNPADLAALKSEVLTDPISMGYNWEQTQDVLKKLNDPANNVGGETISARLTIQLLLDAVMDNPDSLTVGGQFTQGELEAVKMVFEASDTLLDDIERYRPQITGMFQANDGLRQALEAQNRPLSRAEVLFGEGENITKTEWYAARDS